MDNDKEKNLNSTYLVSDDEGSDVAHANGGITLPGNANATHNIELSPFFLTHSGRGRDPYNSEYAIIWRGQGSYLWSNVSNAIANDRAYYLIADSNVLPSFSYTRLYPFPLRCLVSTNNG